MSSASIFMTLLGDEKSNLVDEKEGNLVDKESNEQNLHSDVTGLIILQLILHSFVVNLVILTIFSQITLLPALATLVNLSVLNCFMLFDSTERMKTLGYSVG